MATYKIESILEIRRAEDASSARVAFATGLEHVVLTLDWRLASELIDRLAVVNNDIRHSLAAPDTRAQRLRAGCHRVGLVLAVLTALPALWGIVGWLQGAIDAEGWRVTGALLLAAPLVYAVIWGAGWIAGAFIGTRERQPNAGA
jgi:hypothetical protein